MRFKDSLTPRCRWGQMVDAGADKDLIGVNNGGEGLSQATGDSRLSFKKGDTFSKIFKSIHDLELKYGDTGVFVRGKYWFSHIARVCETSESIRIWRAATEMTKDSNSQDGSKASQPTGTQTGMAAPASPELTGGAGFTFEDGVAAVYAAALLAEATAPGLPGRVVTKLSVQQGAMGHPLDDVIVDAEGVDEVRMRLSLQVKRKLVVSDADTNSDFRETIHRAHLTVSGSGFQPGVDRVGAVTNEISDASKRTFETLCEWARAESDTPGFVTKLGTKGVAGEKATHFTIVKNLIAEISSGVDLDAAAHKLLAHFVLMRLEMLHEGSTTEAQTVAMLANCLHPADQPRADDLWRRLLALVRIAEGMAASFNRKTLVARLNGAFQLSGAPSLRGPIRQISEESKLAVAEVLNTVAGVSVPRERYVQASREALLQSSFVQIGGLPGTGKSVVLRSLVEEALAVGPALFIKADRLTGVSWTQYANATGIGGSLLEDLMVELAATGTPIVFIDGIDRVEVSNRSVLLDIFNTILASPLLQEWKVIATVRDTGMEPVRTWLPPGLLERGLRIVEVKEFDDDEAKQLANARPPLYPLLFGNPQVQAIVRRPFFAAVLVKHNGIATQTPGSEVELATAWWLAGGYGAEAANAMRRRTALVQLARAGANQLGRKIPSLDIDPEALAELEADGIVRPVRAGLSVKFSHDIYFEWAFLQLLASMEDRWIETIREVGEPPVLGRVVELLSQSELTLGEDWPKHLTQLEGTGGIRSQWQRAWLIGPFGLPTFDQYEPVYRAALMADEAKRVVRLAVWFQAEKTTSNPIPLNPELVPDLDMVNRLVLADAMSLPSDYVAWRRFCLWLVCLADQISITVRPEMTSVFEVWQNALSNHVNPVSDALLLLANTWLTDLEDHAHSNTYSNSYGPWDALRGSEREDLESRLRMLLFKAGSAYPEMTRAYLARWQAQERVPAEIISDVFLYAPTISRSCPDSLVAFAQNVFLESLPDVVARSPSKSEIFIGSVFSHSDWDSLSIDDSHKFFPVAPTREPFHSLFSHAPDQARELVRCLANHASEAWRQLHHHHHERRGTPIPLTLRFPWGEQTFWGDQQQYMWARGAWGPNVVSCGLMALEAWAFAQVAAGCDTDAIIHEILAGHQSVAALGIAVAMMLETQHCSETTLPLMASQRIWKWDIQRYGGEVTRFANLMGFEPKDKIHFEAVSAANARPSRRHEVRWHSSLCVVRDGELGSRLAAAIRSFPDDLPFDYYEQISDTSETARLQRTAEIWAESGKQENYRAKISEDGSKLAIHLDNPRAQDPDIDAINREHAEFVERIKLLNWIDKFFESRSIDTSLSVKGAIERAQELDCEKLFADAQSHTSAEFQSQGAVAGIAAVVLSHGNSDAADYDWAVDICNRACATPETPEYYVRSSVLLHHPVLYARRGLSALTEDPSLGHDAQALLIRLAAHPYEQIGIEAIGGLLRGWQRSPEAAWAALGLAVALSMNESFPFATPAEEQATKAHDRMSQAVDLALRKLTQREQPPAALPKMPPAWVPCPDGKPAKHTRHGRTVLVGWEQPSTEPDTSWLGKILGHVPLDAMLADLPRSALFLAWCDGLVEWTVERIYPSWSRPPEGSLYEGKDSDLYEWRRVLYLFLGQLSLHLDVEEGARRFLEPSTRVDDKTFCSLADYYVSRLACSVMDEPVLPTTPLELLGIVVKRMLECERLRRAKGRNGSLHDSELSRMVRNVFFVEVERANGSSRFANGNWSDLEAVLPLTFPLLELYGQVPKVTDAFLTRCERAFEHYPLAQFVAELPHVLNFNEGMPGGWRGSSLPARIAGLIQRFSEKSQPLPLDCAQALLRGLDTLVDIGDRRAAAVQTSEAFKNVRTVKG